MHMPGVAETMKKVGMNIDSIAKLISIRGSKTGFKIGEYIS